MILSLVGMLTFYHKFLKSAECHGYPNFILLL